jgi:hypothetical protein
MTPQEREATAYIRAIRNEPKQAYAIAYLAYLKAGSSGAEPARGDLSYMAAQAVRLHLYNVLNTKVSNV